MVAGYVSKDSSSRCDIPSTLYDVVRNPNAPRSSLKPVVSVSSKDTIETTEQRLKREMIDRFQAKGLELPHETYVAVVQVGKYVFLAVMLPVYLGLYGIPHWFLVTALPQVFGLAGKFSKYCGRFMMALSKRVADLMKGMLEQLIGDALRLSRDRAKNLWKRLAVPFVKSTQAAEQAARAIFSSIRAFREALAQALQQFHSRASQNTQTTNRWIVDNAVKIARICSESVKKSLTWADQNMLTPSISFCLPAFRLAAHTGTLAKNKVYQLVKTCRRTKQIVLDPVFERARRGQLALRKAVGAVLEPIVEWAVEKKEVLHAWLGKMKKAVEIPAIAALAFVKSHIPDVVAAGWNVVKPVFSGVSRIAGKGARFIWKTASQKFKDDMDRKRQGAAAFGSALLRVARGAISGAVWIIRGVGFLIRQFYKWAVYCLKVVGMLLRKLAGWLAVLPRKIKRISISIFKVIASICSYISFALHVIVLLVWLAFLNGFYLMRRVLQQN